MSEQNNELISCRGKFLRDMSREELIEVIAVMVRQMDEQSRQHRSDLEWISSLQPPSYFGKRRSR